MDKNAEPDIQENFWNAKRMGFSFGKGHYQQRILWEQRVLFETDAVHEIGFFSNETTTTGERFSSRTGY